ncbi:MAG: FAD-dependent oxidoreductase [Moraxellaceae bacterium]
MPLEVAVVGAGMAGLSCARRLAEAGMSVTVFDKSRGAGGRMATRRVEDVAAGSFGFDHGAQYFTAHSTAFQQAVGSWIASNVVQPWAGRLMSFEQAGELRPVASQPRYVGVPRMSAIGRHLLGDLPFHAEHRLLECQYDGQYWHLQFDAQPTVLAKYLVLALPSPQVVDLLEINHQFYADAVLQDMLPSWTLMLQCAAPIEVPFDGCFVNSGILSWVARNNSKPARAEVETWVLHASREWSQAHVDASRDWVAEQLLAAFTQVVGQPVQVAQQWVHRWLYALASEALTVGCWYEPAQQFGIAGDWLNGSRVEGAWLSGQQLAARVMASRCTRELSSV